MNNNAKIKDIWFADGNIYLETTTGEVLHRRLEAFPLLFNASEDERQEYTIVKQGDALRWPLLDEDIHISSFYEPDQPVIENKVRNIFLRFPQLDATQIAVSLGISSMELYKYIHGFRMPSDVLVENLSQVIHKLGQNLINA